MFMREHLKQPIPSPTVLRPIHDRFVAGVEQYAERHRIPLVHLEHGQRKDDIAREQLRLLAAVDVRERPPRSRDGAPASAPSDRD